MGSALLAIRHAIRDIVQEAGTAAGLRVFANRYTRPGQDELPVVLIWTKDEDIEQRHTEWKRTARVVVEVVCKGNPSPIDADANPDDDVDLLLQEVEIALDEDHTFAGTAADSTFVRAEYAGDDEGEVALAAGRLELDVEYYEPRPKQAVVHEPLVSAGVKWDLGPSPDGLLEAEDELELDP